MQSYALISTLVGAIVLAFLFGIAAKRAKLPPILGYLLAGVAIGPFTPGFVGDPSLAPQLAEIGVILLMFGVGLKFSVQDLWAVRGVAIPGAIVQMLAATGLGYGLGLMIGLPAAESLMLGLSLSVASTVVLLRALEDRGLLKSENGRICIGWLVVEDLAIVLAIVVLPAALTAMQGDGAAIDYGAVGLSVAIALGKVIAFAALMLIVGARVFPWFILRVAHMKSRELMSLGTLAIALGLAYAAYAWFDASFALGAFLAGLALNGSRVSHRIAEDSLPLRDTFAVLFFVSVGMLFDYRVLIEHPLPVIGVAAIVIIGKSLAALIITTLFKLPLRTGVLIAASLAQIGEFSFILAAIGQKLGVVSGFSYNLMLAAALISIAVNPFLFSLAEGKTPPADEGAAKPIPQT
ncbi:MAG: cation:proton antiporter [Hyphomonadaceae bacterium]